jgi:hypothetical protein
MACRKKISTTAHKISAGDSGIGNPLRQQRSMQTATAKNRIGRGIRAVARLFVQEQRCGCRWPAIDAGEIKRPARPPKPFSHINFKGSAIPAFKSPTGDIRIKEVIEECGIVDRLNGQERPLQILPLAQRENRNGSIRPYAVRAPKLHQTAPVSIRTGR